MPNVGGKQFPYTPQGQAQANKYRALLDRMKQRQDPRARGGEIGVAAELDAGSDNPQDPIPVQGKTRSPLSLHGENMGRRAMPEKRDASTRTESSILITIKIHQGDAGIHARQWRGGDEQNRGGSDQGA